MKTIFKLASACVILSMTVPVTGMAAVPRDVSDLIGARAAGGETALQSRGYVHIKTQKSSDTAWSYWWNGGRKQCLMVATNNGRYDDIRSTTSADCNQDSKDNTAALVIGAAALIGALALAHSAHEHKEKEHAADQQAEADFDRGYRDGQYHHPFDTYNRSDAYSEGYEAGTRSRDDNSPHRSVRHDTYDGRSQADGYGSSSYGRAAPVGYSDLNGARASSADSELHQRGFDNVDAFKSGNASYTIWFNAQTRQCLQMTVADGRVDSLLDIQTHERCR